MPSSRISSSLSTTVALTAILLAIGLSIFSESGPFIVIQSVLLIALGLVIVLYPPPANASGWIVWPAVLFLISVALSFLPASWVASSEWRAALELNGVDTGSVINPHWRQGVEYFARVVIGLILLIYLAGHRVSSLLQYRLLLGFCTLVGGYALLSMLVHDLKWKLAWDPYDTFGFFANHNLSATLLVMGALAGAGAIWETFRRDSTGLVALPIVTTMLCAWALAFYSGTRMGPVLLVAGVLIWLAALGVRHYTKSLLWFATVTVAALLASFALVDSRVKVRLLDSAGKIWNLAGLAMGEKSEHLLENVSLPAQPNSTSQSDEGEPRIEDLDYVDVRFAIYADTLTMIKSEPWTGVGLGMFEYVFPQYRHESANSALCLHPESDWLWVAAESGLVAAFILLAGVVILVSLVIKDRLGQPSWPMDSACLLAACMVPLHGLVDIPGHSSALSLAAVWLVSLTRRPVVMPEQNARALPANILWRVPGAALLLLGVSLGTGMGWGNNHPAIMEAKLQAYEAPKLYDAVRAIAANEPATEQTLIEQKLLLEQAITHLDKALTITPMEPELYFQKGVLSLNLAQTKETDRSFAIHRLLVPYKPGVAMRQAAIWSKVDPNRALSLMAIAMSDANKPSSYTTPAKVYTGILQHFESNENLAERILQLTGGDEVLLELWISASPPARLAKYLPALLNEQTDQALKTRTLEKWALRDESGAKAYLQRQQDL